MNYGDWYTDLVDVHRVRSVKEGNLTKQERAVVLAGVPCRVYRSSAHPPRMGHPAATAEDGGDKLACANEVDIRAGDELLIRRGARLGRTRQTMRGFAGEPAYFYEPFGAVMPGLAHQEIGLLQREYLKGDGPDESGGGAGGEGSGAGETRPRYPVEAVGDCGGSHPAGY